LFTEIHAVDYLAAKMSKYVQNNRGKPHIGNILQTCDASSTYSHGQG
jgi:hypothetical protein